MNETAKELRMSELFFRISLAGLALLMTRAAVAQETISLSRQDQQAVTVTAYSPKLAGCKGIALVSPGAGGSEKGYQYLGEAMAALGYLTLVVGHRESGRDALREHVRGHGLRAGLSELITDPKAYRGRFMDIAASKAWAASRCNAPESILIGHSMGAATTMMEAGARNKLGVKGADGFSAYIALSPQGAGTIFPRNAWSDIKRPVLSITGTRDSELGGASWQTRTEPYQDMPAACKWLAVIEGATHMNFAGHGVSRRTETLSTQVIADFLEGMHRDDCKPTLQSQGLDLQSK
ncbi:alpha/beta hydrolase [Paucibacter sp. AS339]|uniref:alpha/beta hydrolase family protein n=1 Tax=Paucibacter hankyongi TaxID=3133434 RepID=UPI0030974836